MEITIIDKAKIPHRKRAFGANTLKILNIIDQSPGKYTMAAIGNIVGITREWVRQIILREALQDKIWHGYRCSSCGKKLKNKNKTGMCNKCKVETNRVTVACDECGKVIKKIPSIYYRCRHHFCDYTCRSKYSSRLYGFQPGQGQPPSTRKIDVVIKKVDVIPINEIPNKNQWR